MNNLAELVDGPTLHVSCQEQGTCCVLSVNQLSLSL